MIGAITGDYIGSIYEFDNTQDRDFPLVETGKEITDDSICTIAIANAILKGMPYADSLKEICKRHPYPMGAYGSGFLNWLWKNGDEPYNSCGNGSAMRVSPVGWAFDKEDVMLKEAEKSSACTHNHPEGIKGAQATAHAIWFFRHHKDDIEGFKRLMTQYYPDWETFEKPFDQFNAVCQNTVPLCIQEVVYGQSYEDTLRNTILCGGDTDTNGAIAGAMAGARWGVPKNLWEAALATAAPDLKEIILAFIGRYKVVG
ncbi:MAG: ADP-ribosylglycohydrolase family protein [Paludibacteraceae bacterium]|nr:ADP-ribosylglycohydrolase family protein [Paludibacteraceae bacterium]